MDLTKIEFDFTSNYKQGRSSIKYIIIHVMEGSYQGTRTWFKNPISQVSAHYLISKKGEVVQMVKDSNTAWHCYGINNESLGIELEGFDENSNNFTQPMLSTAADLTATLMKKYNVPLESVLGHDTPWIQKLGGPKYAHYDPGKYFPWTGFRKLIQDNLKESSN